MDWRFILWDLNRAKQKVQEVRWMGDRMEVSPKIFRVRQLVHTLLLDEILTSYENSWVCKMWKSWVMSYMWLDERGNVVLFVWFDNELALFLPQFSSFSLASFVVRWCILYWQKIIKLNIFWLDALGYWCPWYKYFSILSNTFVLKSQISCRVVAFISVLHSSRWHFSCSSHALSLFSLSFFYSTGVIVMNAYTSL